MNVTTRLEISMSENSSIAKHMLEASSIKNLKLKVRTVELDILEIEIRHFEHSKYEDYHPTHRNVLLSILETWCSPKLNSAFQISESRGTIETNWNRGKR